MEIIFVKTREVYDSYLDFWTLVELSGFPFIYVDEVDISQEGIYITAPLNGNWEPHLKNQEGRRRNAHLIQWLLERPAGSAGAVSYYANRQWELIGNRMFDDIWVSDRRLADETGLRFVVLGSDEGLGEPGEEKIYDFCHMSYMVPRRTTIYNHLIKSLSPDAMAPNCWPPKRDTVLKQSKFALNIHQDVYPYQEPLRFALFAAYGLPILTELITDSYPFSDEFLVYAPWSDLSRKFIELVNDDYDKYRDMGLRTRDRMCKQFRFREMVLQAVKESVDRWR